ncbi:unnamed protein product [Calypogeia fissa]
MELSFAVISPSAGQGSTSAGEMDAPTWPFDDIIRLHDRITTLHVQEKPFFHSSIHMQEVELIPSLQHAQGIQLVDLQMHERQLFQTTTRAQESQPLHSPTHVKEITDYLIAHELWQVPDSVLYEEPTAETQCDLETCLGEINDATDGAGKLDTVYYQMRRIP